MFLVSVLDIVICLNWCLGQTFLTLAGNEGSAVAFSQGVAKPQPACIVSCNDNGLLLSQIST